MGETRPNASQAWSICHQNNGRNAMEFLCVIVTKNIFFYFLFLPSPLSAPPRRTFAAYSAFSADSVCTNARS